MTGAREQGPGSPLRRAWLPGPAAGRRCCGLSVGRRRCPETQRSGCQPQQARHSRRGQPSPGGEGRPSSGEESPSQSAAPAVQPDETHVQPGASGQQASVLMSTQRLREVEPGPAERGPVGKPAPAKAWLPRAIPGEDTQTCQPRPALGRCTPTCRPQQDPGTAVVGTEDLWLQDGLAPLLSGLGSGSGQGQDPCRRRSWTGHNHQRGKREAGSGGHRPGTCGRELPGSPSPPTRCRQDPTGASNPHHPGPR